MGYSTRRATVIYIYVTMETNLTVSISVSVKVADILMRIYKHPAVFD